MQTNTSMCHVMNYNFLPLQCCPWYPYGHIQTGNSFIMAQVPLLKHAVSLQAPGMTKQIKQTLIVAQEYM